MDDLTALLETDPLIGVGAGLVLLVVVLVLARLLSAGRPVRRDAPLPPTIDTGKAERPGAPPPSPKAPERPPQEGQLDRMEESLPADSPVADEAPEPAAMRRSRPRPSASQSIGEEKTDHYVVRCYYGTDRDDEGAHQDPDDRFNDDRARQPAGGSPMTYGHVDVSIPKIHKVGELEAPSWFQSEQPGKHIMLLSLTSEDPAAFFANLKTAIGDRRQAFVFVHGFSVTFEDAARRTAQLAFDLKFDGAPIFFSWPTEILGLTNPDLTAYSEAGNNARWATQHFRQFLQDVIQKTGASTVHLIAHSMGNRIVTDALMELYWILNDAEKEALGEVILTAPDIDADVFIEQIAPRITDMNSAVTLYASNRDSALATSKRVHGYPRIGDFGAVKLLASVPNTLDWVDASNVDTDSLGHSYYGNSESVISDICHVIGTRTRASARSLTLASMAFEHGAPYWSVKRDTDIADVIAALDRSRPPVA